MIHYGGPFVIYPINPSEPTPEQPLAPASQTRLINALILVGATVGFVMSQQSASLLTGTGILWTGFAIAAASGVAAMFLKDSVPTWIRVLTVLVAVISLASVLYVEHQLEEKRQAISEIFNG